jgi:cation:H+ antiporter
MFTLIGLVGLPIGATLLVENGSALAMGLGVREELVGLTVVAFGTSLPELATVFAAALKKQAEVAAGSIIGSNIFNMLFVGTAAGIAGQSRFTETALALDLPVMIGATAFVSILIFSRIDFTRLTGIAATGLYVFYIGLLGVMGLS